MTAVNSPISKPFAATLCIAFQPVASDRCCLSCRAHRASPALRPIVMANTALWLMFHDVHDLCRCDAVPSLQPLASHSRRKRVTVLGAGMAGLCAARQLQAFGLEVAKPKRHRRLMADSMAKQRAMDRAVAGSRAAAAAKPQRP